MGQGQEFIEVWDKVWGMVEMKGSGAQDGGGGETRAEAGTVIRDPHTSLFHTFLPFAPAPCAYLLYWNLCFFIGTSIRSNILVH